MRGKCPPELKIRNAGERDYILQMVKDGVLESAPRDMVDFNNPSFFIYRPGKRRLIFDGRRVHAATKPPPRFSAKNQRTVSRLAARHTWAAKIDLKNMFFSGRLEESTKRIFGIRVQGFGQLRYTRLPFGYSWSPFVMHLPTDEIVKRLLEQGYKATKYVDDYHIFGDSEAEAMAGYQEALRLFNEAGFRVNTAKSHPPRQRLIALGVEYDLINKSSRVLPEALHTLTKHHLDLISGGHSLTRKAFAGLLGSLVFFDMAMPGFLCSLNQAIAVLSSTANYHWRTKLSYGPLSRSIEEPLKLAWATGWFPLLSTDIAPEHVYSDATPQQLGICYGNTQAGVAIEPTTVYRAEAKAASWLLVQDLPKAFCLRTDNAALSFALRKGRSRILEANQACAKLFRLRKRGHQASVKWIPTAENPADQPSRTMLAPKELFVSPWSAQGQPVLAPAGRT
jgi:hypothetical protein